MSKYRNYSDEWIIESDAYFEHISAMTLESLNSKADIAAELAFRDEKISSLEQFHTAKHNRDVALTDLLAELGERYAHVFTPQELERIKELTCAEEQL